MKRKADARLTKIAEASVNQQADVAWMIAAADLGGIVLGKSADSWPNRMSASFAITPSLADLFAD